MTHRVLGVNINYLTDESEKQFSELLEALAVQFAAQADVARASKGIVDGTESLARYESLAQIARQQQAQVRSLFVKFITTYTRESCEYVAEEVTCALSKTCTMATDTLSEFQEWYGQVFEAVAGISFDDGMKRVRRIDKALRLRTHLLATRGKARRVFDEVATTSAPLRYNRHRRFGYRG